MALMNNGQNAMALELGAHLVRQSLQQLRVPHSSRTTAFRFQHQTRTIAALCDPQNVAVTVADGTVSPRDRTLIEVVPVV
jgi:hypothetical protein